MTKLLVFWVEPCQRENTSEGYAVRHNPWVYFVDEQDDSREFNASLDSFAADVANGSLPHAGMVNPNVCTDDYDADNQVLTSMLHPSLDGVVSDTYLTHYSLSRRYGEVLGPRTSSRQRTHRRWHRISVFPSADRLRRRAD